MTSSERKRRKLNASKFSLSAKSRTTQAIILLTFSALLDLTDGSSEQARPDKYYSYELAEETLQKATFCYDMMVKGDGQTHEQVSEPGPEVAVANEYNGPLSTGYVQGSMDILTACTLCLSNLTLPIAIYEEAMDCLLILCSSAKPSDLRHMQWYCS